MTIDQLENLTIFEIREIARRAGIVPGTRRKSEIIEDIIAVSEGKITPNSEKKYGRPPKSLGFADYYMSLQYPVTTNEGSEIVLKQPPIQFKYGEVLEITGYFEMKSNGAGLLWEQDQYHYNKYIIPAALVEKYNLKQGDKLFVMASATTDASVVKEVFRINDIKTSMQPNYSNFENTQHLPATAPIKNELNLNLKFGETYFINSENNAQNTKTLINLINGCTADYKLYINPTIAEKSKSIIASLKKDVEPFVTSLTDSPATAKDVVILAINRAKRIFESGKKCIVLIDDVSSVSGLSPEDDIVLRSLLNLTKNSEHGSITIIASVRENKYTAQYFKLADEIFNVIDNKIV